MSRLDTIAAELGRLERERSVVMRDGSRGSERLAVIFERIQTLEAEHRRLAKNGRANSGGPRSL